LNDRADLGLIKRSDGHCVSGRREGEAEAEAEAAGDECGRDELLLDDSSFDSR
jgi:hypothetical protein